MPEELKYIKTEELPRLISD